MSCVQPTPAMAEMLEALANHEPSDQFRGANEWENALAWGWVVDSGELTEAGHEHTGRQSVGMVRTGLREPWLTPKTDVSINLTNSPRVS